MSKKQVFTVTIAAVVVAVGTILDIANNFFWNFCLTWMTR